MLNQQQQQQDQQIDVEGIVSKALIQCQSQITSVIGFMIRNHQKMLEELNASNKKIEELEKELSQYKKSPTKTKE